MKILIQYLLDIYLGIECLVTVVAIVLWVFVYASFSDIETIALGRLSRDGRFFLKLAAIVSLVLLFIPSRSVLEKLFLG